MTTTNTTHRVLRMTLVALLASLCVSSALAQTTRGTASEFRLGTNEAKREALRELGAHRAALSAGELRTTLEGALDDDDSGIRAYGLRALTSRAGSVRLSNSGDFRERWLRERPVFSGLRSHVARLLRDSDPEVRSAAVTALVNLDYDGGTDRGRYRLSQDTIEHLSELFNQESTTTIRGQIANEFALSPTHSPVVTDLLLAALQDPALAEVALFGLGERRLVQVLPRVVELLGDQRVSVRLAAAQALASYGPVAVPYIVRLEEAIRVENDAIVKKTMEGTINVLTRGNEPQRPPR